MQCLHFPPPPPTTLALPLAGTAPTPRAETTREKPTSYP